MKLRALIALTIGGVLSALFGITSTASAAPAAAPVAYPQNLCSTVSVSTTHPAFGEAITVTGSAFEPNSAVKLVLQPVGSTGGSTTDLKTVRSDASGAFSTQVTMPNSTVNKGNYDIKAVSGYTTGGSCPADPYVQIALGVAGQSTSTGGTNGGGTAFTGVDIALLVALGVALVVVGGVLTVRGRRRVGA